ncbi:glyoxalase-like domain protein [Pseudoduganella sp. FT26W]|uniref:Glyoxalase-like domain protein n=1 Tax=Duganella aquatilis TaxID=2666082 RepID=A0A844D475_9BURK|nr:VOC family protein [Duganella aquatilis]MRW83442.1 glyoxalase-like domain protein [Duganella aquatilis]
MQIDHLFIRVASGGAEAEALRAFGLSEGSGNVHPGQGTANRRFCFANAFIELLWMADETEIANQTTRPTMLRERLSGADASPFGVCFRPAVPFATWNYAPAYLPPGMQIGIATDAPLTEPMWFCTSAGKASEFFEDERRQPLRHAAGLGAITGLRCTLPSASTLSPAAQASGITFAEGPQLLEISFDHEARGLHHDFRPALPLIFKY